MRERAMAGLAIVAIPLVVQLSAQTRPDLSGTWTFVSAEAPGARGGRSGVAVRVLEVSGAAFNCGAECTIVQDARALTIARTPDPDGVKRPVVVLNLDGRASAISQSMGSSTTFSAKAEWTGNTLTTTRALGLLTIRQTISIENSRLTIRTWINAARDDTAPVQALEGRT